MPRDRLLEGGHQRRLPEGRTAGEVCFPTVEGLGRACQAEGRARGCGLAGVLWDPGTSQFSWGTRGSGGDENGSTRDKAQSTGDTTSAGEPSQGFQERRKRDS